MMKQKAISYIVFSTFLFGLMNVLIKLMPDIPSYEIVLFRSVVSFSLSLFLLVKRKIFPFGKTNKLFLIIRGLAGSIALILFFYTLQRLPLATAVTIQYLAPIFTILFASVLLKEYISWKQWLFFLISFAGILMIRGFDARASSVLLILGIIAAACSGLAYNAVRRVKNDEPALVIVFYVPLITIPLITPFSIMHWSMPEGVEWFYLVAVGVLTQFAQLYMTAAYQMEKPGSIANYTYLGIVFALLFGYFIFNETFGLIAMCGMGLVISGIVLNYFYVNRVTSAKRFLAYLRHLPGL